MAVIDKDKSIQLELFKKWLPTVPRDVLERMLLDAFWKGALNNNELRRYFLVESYQVKQWGKMVQMIQRSLRGREYRLFKKWFEELNAL